MLIERKMILEKHHVFLARDRISNGNRTSCRPVQSVIIRVITKSDDRGAGGRFFYHQYDYRLN